MVVRNYDGIKIKSNSVERMSDGLTIEEALQISINKKPFTVTMRTPGEDLSLIRGLLHTEGILKNRAYLPDVSFIEPEKEGIVRIAELNIPENELGDGYLNSRSLLSVSSCGICGRTELNDTTCSGHQLPIDFEMSSNQIHEMFLEMKKHQKAFEKSGGTHAAATFSLNGQMLSVSEDIGRHNAVDKVIGKLLLNSNWKEAKCLIVSGRISYEIIVKCFKAKIPVLAAVSAPSSLAVDFAKELGITLLAFCREERMTCYSHPQRIKNINSSL
ncbi:MAG: formate dehydrogenase accessory sulfurtransferase FdhD [Flavobacteriales bacterium]|nr:formate dehydrogenase accessory sulfurtransferase FdhD [Flavobacteriales bacterium]